MTADTNDTETTDTIDTEPQTTERTIGDLIIEMGDVAVALKTKGVPWPETTKLIDVVFGYALARQQLSNSQPPFGFPGVNNADQFPDEEPTDGDQ